MDLVNGAVIFMGNGKGADALQPFWKRLKRAGAKIFAVAMDMSTAHIQAVQENLPQVPLVFDHFHVVKLMSDKLTKIRRTLYHELKDTLGKQVLKGIHWILLKNPENINAERNEQQRLKEALEYNEPLAIAYYLKEGLRSDMEPEKQSGRGALS